MNKIPQRTCIVCRKKGDKKSFIRVVKTTNGDFVLDKNSKINGRGAYICNSEDCIYNCKKNHALSRAFKQDVAAEIYDKIVLEYHE